MSLSVAVHSVEPSGLIRLTNMWAARPQKEQVGNVSLSLSLCVCLLWSICVHGLGEICVSVTLLGLGSSVGSCRRNV